MSTTRNAFRPLPFYAGVFVVCAALMVLQIAMSRLLSVTTYYHVAFFAISMAMFGMTAGAVWVHFQGRRFGTETLSQDLARMSVAFAISTAGSAALLTVQVPIILALATTIIIWAQLSLILALPFFFAGVVVSLALTRSPLPIGRVYACDLAGAAAGSLGALLLLSSMDAISAMIATAALGAAAAEFFSRAGAPALGRSFGPIRAFINRPAFLGVLLGCASALNAGTFNGLQPIVVKAEVDRRNAVSFEGWNSYSRIRVRDAVVAPPNLWGPSDRLDPSLRIEQRYLDIDGSAGTTMIRFDGDLARVAFLRHDITNLAYAIRNRGRAAVIGVGGGRDVLSAWQAGFRDVTGIELNPIIIGLLTEPGPFRDFTGLAGLEGVRFEVDDARSWFARTQARFDLIQMSMIDTWAATGAGAFSLSENGLYTVEGWRHFTAALAPDGIFTVSRWFAENDIDETGRILSLAVRTLLDQGVPEPRRHIFLAGSRRLATLVLARAPLSAAEIAQLRSQVEELGFFELIAPDRVGPSPLLEAIANTGVADALDTMRGRGVLDLSPPTDDRPFFFNQLPPHRLLTALELGFLRQPGVATGNFIAALVLILILLVSVVLVVSTILLPLGPAMRTAGPRLAVGGSAYFLLIGLGFMFVEIALLQRLSVFLGHPTYALAIVLFSIVLSTGLGSLLSDRWPIRALPPFLAWAVGLAAYLLLLPVLFDALLWPAEGVGILRRAVVAVALVVPAGMLMGFGFPTGMRLAEAIDPRPTPWFWGINGAGGVLGSVLAVACGISFGISTTLIVGAACYLLLIPAAALLQFRPTAATTSAGAADSR